MHTNAARRRRTARPRFLPWHRAYLLDLERELQAIDPSVALPYWRFDQPAPNLFTPEFLGVVRRARHRALQRDQPAAVLEDRRRPGHQPPAVLRHLDRPRRSCSPRAQTLALGNRATRHSEVDGGQPARVGAHELRRLHLAASGRPRAIRSSSCCTATSIGCGRSGSGRFGRFDAARRPRSYDRARRQSDRPQPARHDVAVERHHRRRRVRRRRPAARSRRSPCVAAPGPQPRVRDGLDYQGSQRGPVAARVRLRRRAVR